MQRILSSRVDEYYYGRNRAEDVHMFLTAFQMQNLNIQEHILK